MEDSFKSYTYTLCEMPLIFCYNLLKLYPKIIIFVAWFINVVFLLSCSIVRVWMNLNTRLYVPVTTVVLYLIVYKYC